MAAYSSFVLSMQVAMHRSICKRQLRSDAWIVLRYNRSLLVSEFPDLLESCPNPFISSRSFMSSYFLVEEMTTIRLRFLSLFSMCLGSRGFIFRFFMFRFRRRCPNYFLILPRQYDQVRWTNRTQTHGRT